MEVSEKKVRVQLRPPYRGLKEVLEYDRVLQVEVQEEVLCISLAGVSICHPVDTVQTFWVMEDNGDD